MFCLFQVFQTQRVSEQLCSSRQPPALWVLTPSPLISSTHFQYSDSINIHDQFWRETLFMISDVCNSRYTAVCNYLDKAVSANPSIFWKRSLFEDPVWSLFRYPEEVCSTVLVPKLRRAEMRVFLVPWGVEEADKRQRIWNDIKLKSIFPIQLICMWWHPQNSVNM